MKKRVNLQGSMLVLAINQALVSYSSAETLTDFVAEKTMTLIARPQITLEHSKMRNTNSTTENRVTEIQAKKQHKTKSTKGRKQIEDVTVGATVPQGKKPETNYTVTSSKSATKLDLAPKDTPQSMTNFTQQIMKDQNMETLGNVLSATPGVSIAAYGVSGAAANSIMARGFPVKNYQLDGMMTNEWTLGGPMAVANQDSFLYENIDLVRGSVGLLTGAGNPSASINFTRKKPYAQNQGQFNLKYGYWNNFRQELDYSTALNKSRSWRARAGLTHEKGNYHIERANHKGYSAYGVTELDLGNSSKFTLGGSHQHRRYNEVPPQGMAISYYRGSFSGHNPTSYRVWRQALPRSFNNASRWTYTENNNSQLFAAFQHYFSNDWQLEANYNYARSTNENLFGIMGLNYFSPELGIASFDQAFVDRQSNSHSVDITLKGQFQFHNRPQDFVLGVNADRLFQKQYENIAFSNYEHADGARYYYHPKWTTTAVLAEWFKGGSSFNRIPASMFLNEGSDLDIIPEEHRQILNHKTNFETGKTKQYGIYFATHLRPMDNLSVILGGRYNRNKNKYRKYYYNPYTSNLDEWYQQYWEIGKPNQSTFTPYLGLIYRFTPSINAYASYIKMVTVDTYGGHIVTMDGGYVPPVINKTFETGLKAGFYDNRLNLALAYFNMQQENYPIVATSSARLETPWGAFEPRAKFGKGYSIKGGELTIAGEITPLWKLMAGYVYQSHKKPPSLPDVNFNGMGWDNRYYQNLDASFIMPKQSFKLFTSYQATPKLTIGGGIDWQNKTNAYVITHHKKNGLWWETNDVLFTQKAYSLYSLMASYRFNKYLSASVNISNLTNKAYYTNDKGSYQGEPRKITLQLGAKF